MVDGDKPRERRTPGRLQLNLPPPSWAKDRSAPSPGDAGAPPGGTAQAPPAKELGRQRRQEQAERERNALREEAMNAREGQRRAHEQEAADQREALRRKDASDARRLAVERRQAEHHRDEVGLLDAHYREASRVLEAKIAAEAERAEAREERPTEKVQKFEEWSAGYLNKNQDRQIEERAALHTRYAKALAEQKDAAVKRHKVDEISKAIDALQRRVAAPSFLHRLSGGAARDREELQIHQAQLADAQQRIAEVLGAVATERDAALAGLAERHAREDALAQAYIAERQPAFEAAERSSARESVERDGVERDDDTGGGRERER